MQHMQDVRASGLGPAQAPAPGADRDAREEFRDNAATLLQGLHARLGLGEASSDDADLEAREQQARAELRPNRCITVTALFSLQHTLQ